MKNLSVYLPLLLLVVLMSMTACRKDEILPASQYYNSLSFPDSSLSHSKHARYQQVLDKYVGKGLLGISVLVRDPEGTWLGAGGHADLASGVEMEVGHQFFIASISKIFTAAAIFAYVDAGKLSLDDPASKWLSPEVVEKVDNAGEAQIRHLLNHKSGIRDWYTIALEMARFNETYNAWVQEDILKFVYGKKGNFPVGQTYSYSNTNYVLLGMILEQVAGKSLQKVYEETIFGPLGLASGYYGTRENANPGTVVKGYMDLHGNRSYIESSILYGDELSTGDGGIAINAQDLGVFLDELLRGNVVSMASLEVMRDWFDLSGTSGHIKNGHGLEYFQNDLGVAHGHTGGVDGFNTIAWQYPEADVTIVLLHNFSPSTEADYVLARDLRKELEALAFE